MICITFSSHLYSASLLIFLDLANYVIIICHLCLVFFLIKFMINHFVACLPACVSCVCHLSFPLMISFQQICCHQRRKQVFFFIKKFWIGTRCKYNNVCKYSKRFYPSDCVLQSFINILPLRQPMIKSILKMDFPCSFHSQCELNTQYIGWSLISHRISL